MKFLQHSILVQLQHATILGFFCNQWQNVPKEIVKLFFMSVMAESFYDVKIPKGTSYLWWHFYQRRGVGVGVDGG